jgi:DNA polymerase epsilon subunit 1
MEEEEELQRLQEEAERRDYNREEPEDSELQSSRYEDELDARFGIRKVTEGPARLGWLYNVRPTVIEDSETHSGKAALQLYFIGEDGQTFKAPLPFHPYIYLELKHAPVISSKSTVTPSSVHTEVEQWLRRKYERLISSIEFIAKEDLQLVPFCVL